MLRPADERQERGSRFVHSNPRTPFNAGDAEALARLEDEVVDATRLDGIGLCSWAFHERNEAVKWSCARLIDAALAAKRKVGICGQAPGDYPDFAAFLVERGVDSISLSPDALVGTMRRVVDVEARLSRPRDAE